MASTAYNPTTNWLAGAFNKTIIKLLKKFISSSKRDWNEKFSECPTEQQFKLLRPVRLSLVYWCVAVTPVEIQMSLLRVALTTKMTEGDNDRLRLQEL